MKFAINTFFPICGNDKVKVDTCIVKWFCKSMQYHNDSNECRHGQKVGHIRNRYIFGKVYCDISHSTSQQNFYANNRAEDDLVKYIQSKT